MNNTILIVEDELQVAELLRDYLTASGYGVQLLTEGLGVVAWVRQHQPALILLDIMLPGKDGISICRELRSFSRVPIIMTTARIEEVDRLLGLELGADDYICKPYSPREVVARVRAVLRRSDGELAQSGDQVQVDQEGYRVLLGGRDLGLTAVEFYLFTTLYSQPGRIFSRNQLMEAIYRDRRMVNDRTVDSHIKKLRAKITRLQAGLDLIHSVYGLGYKFED
ncbi:response regulator [Desulfogranum mediterraneum]|uniref:response regulator n=1 Tax=Desulfogranum mediterraneum TaxID=160661 RepID=UPI000422A1EE|nr:response regulator [Desulfogranum mediterraneum]